MAQILLVEPDEDIRASLRALLSMAGHEIADETTIPASLTFLSTTRLPVVVLCGNDCPAHTQVTAFFGQIAAETTLARRHGYIYLTTDPSRIPPPLHALLEQLAVPVMPKPFSIEPLLSLVDDMSAGITRRPPIRPLR